MDEASIRARQLEILGQMGMVAKPARKHQAHEPGKMNRTEEAYAVRLEVLRRAGAISFFVFEGITLRLAHDLRYTPDYVVELPSGRIELHEVKGFWRDDARVKIKAAAALFPCFLFVAVQQIPARAGGGWTREEFEGRKS